jgi:hypothetical protein
MDLAGYIIKTKFHILYFRLNGIERLLAKIEGRADRAGSDGC